MRPESPNRQLAQNVMKIYKTSGRDRGDIQRIVALLSASLEGHVEVGENQLAFTTSAS
jgi:hypothetical protein